MERDDHGAGPANQAVIEMEQGRVDAAHVAVSEPVVRRGPERTGHRHRERRPRAVGGVAPLLHPSRREDAGVDPPWAMIG